MFFFKKQPVDETFNYNIELLQNLKKNSRDLRVLYGQLNKYKIARNIKEICIISDKIVKEITLHQEKITKVVTFMDYYLPTTIKLLEQYLDIKTNSLSGDENAKVLIMIEDTLPKIKVAFNELLNRLFKDDNKDIDIEIKILMNELKNYQ